MDDTKGAVAPGSALPRWLQRFISTTFGEFVLYDVAFSTFIGVIVWLVDHSSRGIIAFFLSMNLFLIIKLYSEMAKMHHEFDVSLHQEDEAIQRVRADVLKVIDLDHAFLRDPDFLTHGPEILKSYSALLVSDDVWFLDRAKVVLKECSQELARLKGGEISHGRNSDFYRILYQQLAATRKGAFFTSDVKTDVAWSGTEGKPYRNLNIQRAKDGISITRVFIVDDLADITGEIANVIKEQVQAGIEVRLAIASKLGSDSMYDMGIYDDRYASYFDLTPNTRQIRAHHTFNTAEALERAIEIRDRLYQNSDEATALLKLG